MSALLHRGELLCAYPAPSAPNIITINPATYISFLLFISSPIVELICLAFSTELAGNPFSRPRLDSRAPRIRTVLVERVHRNRRQNRVVSLSAGPTQHFAGHCYR